MRVLTENFYFCSCKANKPSEQLLYCVLSIMYIGKYILEYIYLLQTTLTFKCTN
jgi:hypothetical protein